MVAALLATLEFAVSGVSGLDLDRKRYRGVTFTAEREGRTGQLIGSRLQSRENQDWRFAVSNQNELFVEHRPDGTYAVLRPGAERASAIENTQAEAINRAREIQPSAAIHVERVRDTSKGSRDKWRTP